MSGLFKSLVGAILVDSNLDFVKSENIIISIIKE